MSQESVAPAMSHLPRRAYIFETNGEHLARFLESSYLSEGETVWEHPKTTLLATGRSDQWISAYREIAVLHLVRQLISGAKAIVERQGELDSVADRDIGQLIVDTMVIDYFRVTEIRTRLTPAVRSARSKISPGLQQEMRRAAQRQNSFCYLCGCELVFDDDESLVRFTLDHVWPRAYGGDSAEENLLPACFSCNNHKDNTPSWSMYPIQGLVAGHLISGGDSRLITKDMRQAVQGRTAADYKLRHGVSLKDAFVALGRPMEPSVLSTDIAVDIFNLEFQARG